MGWRESPQKLYPTGIKDKTIWLYDIHNQQFTCYTWSCTQQKIIRYFESLGIGEIEIPLKRKKLIWIASDLLSLIYNVLVWYFAKLFCVSWLKHIYLSILSNTTEVKIIFADIILILIESCLPITATTTQPPPPNIPLYNIELYHT